MGWVVTLGGFDLSRELVQLPTGLQRGLHGLFIAGLAITLAIVAMRAADAVFEEIAVPWAERRKPKLPIQVLQVGRVAVKMAAGAVAMVTVMQRAGFDVWSIITGLGIGGVAMALAAQQTLGNWFGSLQIMTDQPFGVGDWIRVGGQFGRVTEIGLRSTRLQNTAGVQMIIPNKQVAEAIVENHIAEQGQVREFLIAVPYEIGAARLREVCAAIEAILRGQATVHPEYQVSVWHFGDSAIQLRVIYRVPQPERFGDTSHAVNLAIYELFERHGWKFAYPTQTVHLSSEAKPAAKPEGPSALP
jgi:MscS family membrane protein